MPKLLDSDNGEQEPITLAIIDSDSSLVYYRLSPRLPDSFSKEMEEGKSSWKTGQPFSYSRCTHIWEEPLSRISHLSNPNLSRISTFPKKKWRTICKERVQYCHLFFPLFDLEKLGGRTGSTCGDEKRVELDPDGNESAGEKETRGKDEAVGPVLILISSPSAIPGFFVWGTVLESSDRRNRKGEDVGARDEDGVGDDETEIPNGIADDEEEEEEEDGSSGDGNDVKIGDAEKYCSPERPWEASKFDWGVDVILLRNEDTSRSLLPCLLGNTVE